MMNIGIYPISVCLDHNFHYGLLHHPFNRVFGAIGHAHTPVVTVNIQCFWPGYFSKPPGSTARLYVHLPEAVACSDIPLCVIKVMIISCENMWYPVLVIAD